MPSRIGGRENILHNIWTLVVRKDWKQEQGRFEADLYAGISHPAPAKIQ